MHKKNVRTLMRGFTLIELLVVIAIIGILASIILASLGTARNKAGDAKVQETLSGVRSSAEVYYANNQGYSDGTAVIGAGTDCLVADNGTNVFGDSTVGNQLASLTGVKYCTHNGTATTKATTYAVAFILTSDTAKAWCIDSNGTSKQETPTTPNTLPAGVITGGLCQ